MLVADLISPDRVACDSAAASKKRVLEELSGMIAGTQPSLSPNEVFDSLITRERLGSTGLGHGVAIPHGRVRNSDKTIGAFLRLQHGVDYDAIDNQPVDLVFALLVPEESTEQHLELLSRLAQMFGDPEVRSALRATEDPNRLYELIERSYDRTDSADT